MPVTAPYQVPEPRILQCALLVYANRDAATILRAEVADVNGTPTLRNPTQITGDVLDALVKLTNQRPLQLIDPQVLAMTHDACAWFVPAQPRVLLFNPHSDSGLKALSGRTFPQPPLVFISRGQSLQVYALDRDERPGAGTPLYQPPYWNIMGQGRVCMGTGALPPGGSPSHTRQWEEAFYRGSNFTHAGNSNRRWTSEYTHLELWQAAEAAGQFKPEWLVPAGITLEAAVCTR